MNLTVTPATLAPHNELCVALQLMRPIVLRYCISYLKHADDAEEACQETLLNALNGLNKFENRASLHTWVMKIAYHVCTRVYRKRRDDELICTVYHDDLHTHEEEMLYVQAHELPQSIATLPAYQQDILRHRFVHDHSLKETALIMGLSLSSVKMNYYRALKKLQQHHIN